MGTPSRSTRTPMCSAARSSTASLRSLPSAAQIRPSTPDFDGSSCVSRSSKRLVVPQDCIGPCRRNNNVGISRLQLKSHLFLYPGRECAEVCVRYTFIFRPGTREIEVTPGIATTCVHRGKLRLIVGKSFNREG